MARSLLRSSGYCLKFDGTTTGLTTTYTPSVSAMSLVIKYFPQRVDANDRLIDWQAAGPADGFTLIHPTAGNAQLAFRVNNGAGQTANVTSDFFRLNEWYTIVVTFTPTEVKLYINGVSQGTVDVSAIMTAAATSLTIGKRATGATNFIDAFVDEVVIYEKVLTQEEIYAIRNGFITEGAKIHWKLDDGSGSTAYDYSGNGNSGTITGGRWVAHREGRMTYAGKSNWSLNFSDPVASYVLVGDVAILRPEATNKFTWVKWVYLTTYINNVLPRLIEKGADYTCIMGEVNNLQVGTVALETVNSVDGLATEWWGRYKLALNRWWHVATVFDDGTCTHYINGVPDEMRILANPYVSPIKETQGDSFIIGNSNGGAHVRNWPGFLSDIRAYNVPLTQAEILELYAGVDVRRGLVGQWDFDEGTGEPADSSGNGNNGTITGAIWLNQ